MIVLSLFDGISCGQVALKRAGFKPSVYFASEIDKYAIQITQKNFPKTVQLGDVKNINFENFTGSVDLLMGGSPCQDLSIAKNDRKGLEGERSGLFFYYLNALRIIKPRYFLFENVASMSKDSRDIITNLLGVEPILINSALVSAQNRKRLYWTNIPNVHQPEDRGIKLQDVLESGKTVKGETKSRCVTSSIGRTTDREYFRKNQGLLIDNGDGIRRIPTPLECERLQTLPDGYTEGISNTQRYKCLGNGWTVDVIAHILKNIS